MFHIKTYKFQVEFDIFSSLTTIKYQVWLKCKFFGSLNKILVKTFSLLSINNNINNNNN